MALPDDVLGGSDTPPSLYEQSVANSNQRDSAWLAKAALIGLGVHGLGRAFGVNIYAEAANKYGSLSRYIESLGQEAPGFSSSIINNVGKAIGSTSNEVGARLKGGTSLRSLPFVQDLAEAFNVLEDPLKAQARSPYFNVLKANFDSLGTNRPGASFLHRELKAISVGDILNDASLLQGSADSFEVKLLKHGVSQGLISEEHLLDPNIYKSSAGRVLDTRVLRPNQFLEATAGMFNPFGLTQAIKAFTTSDRTVGLIGSTKSGSPDSLFVGGTIYEATQNKLSAVAHGKTLGVVGDSRHVASLLREAPATIQTDPNYAPTFFDKIQDTIGVGPKFHEKRGGFFQTGIGFFKNVRGVARGDAQFYGREYKYAKDSLWGYLLSPYTFHGTTEAGSKIAEGKFRAISDLAPKDLTPGKGILKGARGWYERMKAYAGFNSDVAIVKSDAIQRVHSGGEAVSKADLYQDFGRAGLDSLERPIGLSSTPQSVTVVGKLDYRVRPKNYAASASSIDRLYDFTNWMTIRLNKLASVSLLGIGFKPSGNLAANVARVAAIPAAYYLGKEAIQYTDYVAGKVLGQGPIETIADLYTKARVAQQELRKQSGIASGANYIENDLLPGIDTGVLGTIGAGLAGIKGLEKTGNLGKAGLVAGAIYGLFGGADVGQDPDSLRREYSGEEKVPVRKARWWLLGYQPFKGGQIDYYKPSWYSELKNKPYNTNVYGSDDNYWKYGTGLPNPNNWFGLRNLIDPYALEKRNYYDRPYPTTSKMFEEVPIIGPVLADTIGQVIKPTKRMHASETGYAVAASNISQRGVPTDAARSLGIPDVPVSVVKLNRPDNLKDRLDKWFNVGLEPSGVWKFALSLFGIKFNQEYQEASASNMSSVTRRFYDMNLGGLFGETEFIRRFLLSEYGSPSQINQQINPIQNTMPRWLPGSASDNPQDKQYFVDFTRGDAYTKIPGGEYRLPGAGYESVNRLHSGVSGVYSDVDKYLILADVAPFSAAFYQQQSIVNQQKLSPYWQWKVSQATEMRDKAMQRYNFSNVSSSQDDIKQLNQNTVTKSIRHSWELIYEKGLSNIPILGAKLFPVREAYDQYIESQIEGETFADWKSPFETIVRPEFYTTIGESPLFAAKRGLTLGTILSSPAASFLSPFPILQANPIQTSLAGAAIGGAGSLIRMASTGSWSHGFVPPHIKREREVQEYFDYLKYAKARYLESQAEAVGNQPLANTFKAQSRNTINYGLTVFKQTGQIQQYQSALNPNDRPFFEAFIGAPKAQQEKILQVVPGHMKSVLSSLWARESSTGYTPQVAVADEAAQQYFETHKLPGKSWQGWSPSVPDTAIQIKAVQAGINGVSDTMHRFGFFPAQIRETQVRFPTVEAPPTDIYGQDENSLGLMAGSLFRKENDNPFSNVSYHRKSFGIGPRVDWFSAYLSDSRRDDVFAFYQDIYR